MEVTVERNNQEEPVAGNAPKQNFAYATTGSDTAVYEVPLQAASDLENTVNRLHSNATAPPSAKTASAAPSPAPLAAPTR